MLHVWDHFDYGTADVGWLKNQGYLLLKVNLLFAHGGSQQLIWELFNAVEKASTFVGETDQAFLSGTSLTVL
jgi:hypothetical protein